MNPVTLREIGVAGEQTLNEDVFPTEKWGYSSVMLVYQSLDVLSS